MASTKIPAIKAAVVETLQAAEALKGIKVTDDREPDRDDEYVFIYKARARRDFKLIGPQPAPQDETVNVYIRIVAIRGTDKAKPSEERALEIFEAVETALRDNSTLGDTALFQRIEDLEIEPQNFEGKRGCHVLATVTAKARI
jgi:hypothetical protein